METKDFIEKVKTQLEYYLSDDNLKNDAFFHEQISESSDGYVPFSTFLNCNKIKKLEATIPQLQEAVRSSKYIELSESGEKARRINNKSLPVLRIKKLYITFDENSELGTQENVVLFVPLILSFDTTSEMFFKARDLERKLKRKLTIEIPYLRVAKKVGVFVFNKLEVDSHAIEDLCAEPVKIDKYNLEMTKLNDSEAESWLRNNRSQLEASLKSRYNFAVIKEKNDRKFEVDENFGPVELAGKKFKDIREFKNQLKILIAKTRNNESLGQKDKELVQALLAHHHNSSEKLKDLASITVDMNPKYPSTRCFFIVKENGDRDDFSFHKCIENFVEAAQNKAPNNEKNGTVDHNGTSKYNIIV